MLKYKQGPMMLSYIAQDHEIVRGRPFQCDLPEAPAATGWYFLTPAGEHFTIPDEQIAVDQEGVHISLTKYDTLALPSDVSVKLCVGDTVLDTFTTVSLAGLELRYWELADAMPDWGQPEFKAFSYALHMAIFRIFGHTDHFFVWAYVDGLREDALDEMAVELRAPYYLETMPLDTKREIVKKALIWHEKAGTLAALNDMISTVYGYGEVVEWPDFSGDPYTFKFISEEPNQDPDFYQRFYELVRKVKNVRSHLAGVDFVREENQNLYIGGAATEIETIDIISDEIPHIYRLTYGYHLGAAVEEIKLATIIYEDIEREPTSIIGNDLYTGGAVHAITVTTITAA